MAPTMKSFTSSSLATKEQAAAAARASAIAAIGTMPTHHMHSRDKIDYNKDLEHLLKDNAEECESLGILHRASYEKYNRLSNYINIPVIILSSAIGFATGIDIGYMNMNIILGVGSIFVGIIKSIDTYFQLGKRSESHRLCSLQYQQIHKKIQIELALTRDQRQTAKDMLSVIKTDIKNLQDISPLVDQDIIDKYNARYSQYTTVKKPNFVNGLTEVAINDSIDMGYGVADVLHSRPRSPSGSGGSNSGDEFSLDGHERDHDHDHDPHSAASYSANINADGGGGSNRNMTTTTGTNNTNSVDHLIRRPPIMIKPIVHHPSSDNIASAVAAAAGAAIDARSISNHSAASSHHSFRSGRTDSNASVNAQTNFVVLSPPNLSAVADFVYPVSLQPPPQLPDSENVVINISALLPIQVEPNTENSAMM